MSDYSDEYSSGELSSDFSDSSEQRTKYDRRENRKHFLFVVDFVPEDNKDELAEKAFDALSVKYSRVMITKCPSESEPDEPGENVYKIKIYVHCENSKQSGVVADDIGLTFDHYFIGYQVVFQKKIKNGDRVSHKITRNCDFPALYNKHNFDMEEDFHILYRCRNLGQKWVKLRRRCVAEGKLPPPLRGVDDAFFCNSCFHRSSLHAAYLDQVSTEFQDPEYDLKYHDPSKYKQDDYRRETTELFNNFATHPWKERPLIEQKEYFHVWLVGPPNSLKTAFIRGVLLYNIPDEVLLKFYILRLYLLILNFYFLFLSASFDQISTRKILLGKVLIQICIKLF
jgi:hypothetical protein